MRELEQVDLRFMIARLPKVVKAALERHPESVCVAGGFIRSVIAHEEINDIDLFCRSQLECDALSAELVAGAAVDGVTLRVVKTDNAVTLLGGPIAIQVIHRWVYGHPSEVLASFDFTIATAAIFASNNGGFAGLCHDQYYSDLAAKRLVYLSPKRNEDAGGSMLRVLKFYQRGYRMPLDSLAAVVARLMTGVDFSRTNGDEEQNARVVLGLLREVDPNTGFNP